jgi:thiamine biosynthesis lipoprotein
MAAAGEELSDRREFLTGRAALRSLAALWDRSCAEAQPVRRFGPQTRSYLLEISRQAMACQFQVVFNAGQYVGAEELATRALDLISQLEKQMTVFDESSELSHINRTAFPGPVSVESRLYELLSYARRLSVATQGAFDITAAPLWRLWGFARRAGRLPGEKELAETLDRVGYSWWLCDDAQQTVRFLRPQMELHLGAIGKGYALDRACEELWKAGVTDFLLHGGQSSVLARGARSGQDGWTIGIVHPLVPQRRLGIIRLRDEALGTTSTAYQYFYHQGRRYGHVLDPRTGMPANQLLAVTVRAPLAATADALSTAFFVMGSEAVRHFWNEHSELGVILVSAGDRAGEIRVETLGLSSSDFVLQTDAQLIQVNNLDSHPDGSNVYNKNERSGDAPE